MQMQVSRNRCEDDDSDAQRPKRRLSLPKSVGALEATSHRANDEWCLATAKMH